MNATLEEELADVRSNPCSSYWLKRAVEELLKRDCLDASIDAEILNRIMKKVVEKHCGNVRVSP